MQINAPQPPLMRTSLMFNTIEPDGSRIAHGCYVYLVAPEGSDYFLSECNPVGDLAHRLLNKHGFRIEPAGRIAHGAFKGRPIKDITHRIVWEHEKAYQPPLRRCRPCLFDLDTWVGRLAQRIYLRQWFGKKMPILKTL